MNTRLKICLLAWLAASASAHAQNSVTLYGLVDEGLDYTNNAGSGSAWRMQSGDVVGSRFGLKGNEDLGSGYSAIFLLENGFDASNGALGQGQRLFGRQAYVGLASQQYGTLTFGRQYDPTIDMFSDLTAAGNWAGNVASSPFDNDNADWDFRVDNSVKYVTPTVHGFTGEAMYAFSNTAGGFAENRLMSAAGQYQNGGLTAAVAYMRIDQPGLGTQGAVTDDSVFVAKSQENIDAAASYRFSKALVGVAYSHTSVDDPTGSVYLSGPITPANGGAWTRWTFDNFQLNGQYFFTPALWLGASYTYTIGGLDTTAGNYHPKWHSASLMLDYDVSKRTSFYMQGAYQHVESAHTGTQFDDAQTPASAGISSSPNQVVYRIAMIHRF
ncbi:porin [Paraburkholderia acidipaludis]|uniref:porin n=1 Tax=Paraburkholderia acidipaludis TaxID=660537 RepID=UPI000487EB85|nr:porin [Paraburkholderia acidipaludis]